MNTYSHFLMTAIAGDRMKRQQIPIHTTGALLGSIMPDVPLTLLTIGYFAYRRWVSPLEEGEFIFSERYDDLYFKNPAWVISHNLFHAPLFIVLMMSAGYIGIRRGWKWCSALFWFGVACGFHTAIDIPTHHHDGPLLLFPFNWKFRFNSRISYWDRSHHGGVFAPLEMLLDLGIIGYFVVKWFKARRNDEL